MIKRRTVMAGAAGVLGMPAFLAHATTHKHRVGLTLPLKGVQAEVANDLMSGYRYAATASEALGVSLEFVVNDDEAKVEAVESAVATFARDPSILAVSGIVGTPHALKALPVARQGKLPVVGLRSGAKELRTGVPGVFHLRASFEAEIDKMLSMLQGAGMTSVSCIYSDDAFGKGALAHLQKTAQERKVNLVSSNAAERSGQNIDTVVTAAMGGERAHALLLFLITKPMKQALQLIRTRHAFMGPVYTMSFTATREIASLADPWSVGLGIISAFPLPRSSHLQIAGQFRNLAIKDKQTPLLQSVTALEGFFYGATIARAIAVAQAKGPVTRETLVKTLLTSHPLDVMGVPVQFDQHLVGYNKLVILHKDTQGTLRG